jgi:hypothetical protein
MLGNPSASNDEWVVDFGESMHNILKRHALCFCPLPNTYCLMPTPDETNQMTMRAL